MAKQLGPMVNDEKIIAALLVSSSSKEAADTLGISVRTVTRRLADAEFKNQYQAACRGLLKDHTAALQGHMGAAIETMREIMDEKKNAPQVRLNAADNILRHGIRMTEQVDILNRLDELEGED